MDDLRRRFEAVSLIALNQWSGNAVASFRREFLAASGATAQLAIAAGLVSV
jgi:hypothetical protein